MYSKLIYARFETESRFFLSSYRGLDSALSSIKGVVRSGDCPPDRILVFEGEEFLGYYDEEKDQLVKEG